jgi:hypothetical protein
MPFLEARVYLRCGKHSVRGGKYVRLHAPNAVAGARVVAVHHGQQAEPDERSAIGLACGVFGDVHVGFPKRR